MNRVKYSLLATALQTLIDGKATKVGTPTENAILIQTAAGDLADSGVLLSALQATSEKNQASGYAGLDASSKLAIEQIPDSVRYGLQYQGTWNATTNTPTIVSSVGTLGHFYIINVAGTTTIDGENDWEIGDWILFNGTTWQKVDNSDRVSSVNGQQGVVVLDTEDVAESGDNTYYTAARSALNEKAANKGAANGYCPLGADQKVPSANLPAGASNTSRFVHTVTSAEITAKKVVFGSIGETHEPSSASDFASIYTTGGLIAVTDFVLTVGAGAEYNWTGKPLDGVIEAGETLTFSFSY